MLNAFKRKVELLDSTEARGPIIYDTAGNAGTRGATQTIFGTVNAHLAV